MSWFYRRYGGVKHVLYDEYDEVWGAEEDLDFARRQGLDGHIVVRRKGHMKYALYLVNETSENMENEDEF